MIRLSILLRPNVSEDLSMRTIVRSFVALILAIVVLCFLVLFIVIPYQVSQSSMAPTLSMGDRIIVNKLKVRLNMLEHGDVVVFQQNGTYHVGRIIGDPGQSVAYQSGQLELDNRPVDEPYIHRAYEATWSARELPNVESDIIPPNQYLVLNDHRSDEGDSRRYGLIDKRDMIGSALLRYFPLNQTTVNFKN